MSVPNYYHSDDHHYHFWIIIIIIIIIIIESQLDLDSTINSFGAFRNNPAYSVEIFFCTSASLNVNAPANLFIPDLCVSNET